MNHFVRKNAHFIIYLALGFLVMRSFRKSGLNRYKGMFIAFLTSVLYAKSDEVHLIFVPGRGAQVRDVLIDSKGAAVGIGAYKVIGRFAWKTKS